MTTDLIVADDLTDVIPVLTEIPTECLPDEHFPYCMAQSNDVAELELDARLDVLTHILLQVDIQDQ